MRSVTASDPPASSNRIAEARKRRKLQTYEIYQDYATFDVHYVNGPSITRLRKEAAGNDSEGSPDEVHSRGVELQSRVVRLPLS